MTRQIRMEYACAIQKRYRQASKACKRFILDEFCAATGYARKYAICKLSGPPPENPKPFFKRKRDYTYGTTVIQLIESVWQAAGYPCSVRLKALLPAWLPWIKKRFNPDAKIIAQMLRIGTRTLDYRLAKRKALLKRRMYGRTKPDTLLKHRISIKTDHWDVREPGWTEIDCVSHSGDCAEGTFTDTVNQTYIMTGWVESRAVLGKGEAAVVAALDQMRADTPFPVKGIDSDNGSEFINWHLYSYCQEQGIQSFRGRPYKKDDNAHIEQKNWTHVRKLIGYEHYDTQTAVDAINELYRNELRLFMNLFLPSMKLTRKVRIGAKLKRVYDVPRTPFERLSKTGTGDKAKIAALTRFSRTLDPFAL